VHRKERGGSFPWWERKSRGSPSKKRKRGVVEEVKKGDQLRGR